MRRYIIVFGLLLMFISTMTVGAEEASMDRVLKFAQNNIQWMGNAGLKISGESTTLYFDPLASVKDAQAGIIFVTHSHSDHLYPEALKKLTGPDTVIVAPEAYVESAKILKPGDKMNIKGIPVEAVPAYNTKGIYHPKSKQWVGYIVTVDGIRIYVSGDTNFIPEMKEVKADIAILSIPGGAFAMDYEEAAKAALEIKPMVAIPVHYKGVVMDMEAGDLFKEEIGGKITVVVLPTKNF